MEHVPEIMIWSQKVLRPIEDYLKIMNEVSLI